MTTLYHSADESSENSDCMVEINDKKISVDYVDADGQPRRYFGHELSEGHFYLECPEISGKASLHRFKEAEILEGSWTEGGYRGMWKIRLA